MSERNFSEDYRKAEGDVVEQYKVIEDFVREVLKLDEDYGTIPSTNKPTLYKSGAEKLLSMIGVHPEFDVVSSSENWTDKFEYSSKFGSKTQQGLAYYVVKCNLIDNGNGKNMGSGLGSCGTGESKYNNKPAVEIANTCLKMALKRSLVSASLTATLCSGMFTQDVEDMDLSDNKPTKTTSTTPPRAATSNSSTSGGGGVVSSTGVKENVWPVDQPIKHGTLKGKLISQCEPEDLFWYIKTAKEGVLKRDNFSGTSLGLLHAILDHLKENDVTYPDVEVYKL